MRARAAPLALALLAAATVAGADTYVWVDEAGVPHISDEPPPEASDPDGAEPAPAGPGALEGLLGPDPVARDGRETSADGSTDRADRLLRGALEDLQRGENARAVVALEAVLRDAPGRPEPHYLLALLDTQRGRYDSAEAHLRAFLAAAGEDLADWRASAQRRLRALRDERRLADPEARDGPVRWLEVQHPHFRVLYDAELGRASSDYARTVLAHLEAARRDVGRRLGASPAEPLGVVFYGRAAYLRAHRHRFSFPTVGFFDGRIHVVSAAHPAGELRALLFHEYAHALFREQTGGDRPYWLNEGFAELSERAARGRAGLTRSERSRLFRRLRAGDWIPLRRLAPGFAGLTGDDARAAYLEAAAAARWIEERTEPAERARLVGALAAGASPDAALRAVLALDTDALDAALQQHLEASF